MRHLRATGLVGVLLTGACSFNASTGQAPPPPQYYAQQPMYAPPPSGRPGVPYVPPPPGQANHPGPGWATAAGSEALNVARIQAAFARDPKACGWLESSPGHWVKVDCHAYRPATRAVAHLSPRKAALVSTKQVQWRPTGQLRQIAAASGLWAPPIALPQSNTIRGVNPTGGGVALPQNLVRADNFPGAVDHRSDNTEGPVKDQGPVGSCTAFSLSTTIDNQAIRLGKMGPNNGQQAASPNHVWSGYGIPEMQTAADSNLNRAIAPLSVWPQNNREACELADPQYETDCGFDTHVTPGSWKADPATVQKKQRADGSGVVKIVSYEQLKTLPFDSNELLTTLSSGNSIWIAMKIDALAFSAQKMKGGVIPDWDTPNGGHAMEMAGYRDTPQGKQFLVHNSWGTSWGEGGYGWISENMVAKFMHLAYKVKLDGAPPAQNTTDDDCAPDDLVDILSGQCTLICPDGSRPNNGCKGGAPAQPGQPPAPGQPAQPQQQPLIPGLPVIPGLPPIPGFPPPPTK